MSPHSMAEDAMVSFLCLLHACRPGLGPQSLINDTYIDGLAQCKQQVSSDGILIL
jgi:hypothetical protein